MSDLLFSVSLDILLDVQSLFDNGMALEALIRMS